MTPRDSRRWGIPIAVYVVTAVGGMVGAFAGDALNLGYNMAYGPWLPQAGVGPQPAGPVVLWVVGGAAVGAFVGLVVSVAVVAVLRLVVGQSSKGVSSTESRKTD